MTYDYEPDPKEGYERDPTDDPEFMRREYERYLRSLSPIGRITRRLRNLIWRYTWRWRIKPNADEPPF
jgi:hypothetical protein